MQYKKRQQALLGALLLGSINLSAFAAEMTTDTATETKAGWAIEWAPFVKATGVDDTQLIAAADVVNSEFLSKQKGFIKRELAKKNETEYADVVYWASKADAEVAGEKVISCGVCGEYFQLMQMGAKAGEGFAHYTILKSW